MTHVTSSVTPVRKDSFERARFVAANALLNSCFIVCRLLVCNAHGDVYCGYVAQVVEV